jgi:hypothetical protein
MQPMRKAFIPPFLPLALPAPRYEKTLKERLAAGEIIKHFRGRFETATMRKTGDYIAMTGFTGSHYLDFAHSDTRRIDTHWRAFCEIPDNASRSPSR